MLSEPLGPPGTPQQGTEVPGKDNEEREGDAKAATSFPAMAAASLKPPSMPVGPKEDGAEVEDEETLTCTASPSDLDEGLPEPDPVPSREAELDKEKALVKAVVQEVEAALGAKDLEEVPKVVLQVGEKIVLPIPLS